MSAVRPWRLFEVTGLEIEYMIVDSATLAVKPIADLLLRALGGCDGGEAELGDLTCSNELALHLVELKITEPVGSLVGVARRFAQGVARLNDSLSMMHARLMPSGMHPWMDPRSELQLWPHESSAIYRAFDRIFDCRGHGWANLQSTHVNLPFGSDEEFGRLHAALRLLLPILPALAASSPVVGGRVTGLMDSRLQFYLDSCARVPSVSGMVIPEPVFSREEYESVILRRIYEDLAAYDPEGTLRHEWVNARGCIPRFDRGAIEVRLLDAQECPAADAAVAATVAAAARALVRGELGDWEAQRYFSTERLVRIMRAAIEGAEQSVVCDEEYLRLLGWKWGVTSAGALWEYLVEATMAGKEGWGEWRGPLGVILRDGPLARRLAKRLGKEPDRERIRMVYLELCRCLAEDVMLDGEDRSNRVNV